MEFLTNIIDIFLHLDVHLNALATTMGPWLYVLLFVIVFCETGLVVTPFLPGDSLLFAVGALASIDGSPINIFLVITLLFVAAVLGDAANYAIGKYIGPKVFKSEESKWLNKKYLQKAHDFYEKYGGKTIILARFIPIIRTFAPFVAGAGSMTYKHFFAYNVVGAAVWVVLFGIGGFLFGEMPFVQKHFHYVIVAIIVISVLPAIYEVLAAKMKNKKA